MTIKTPRLSSLCDRQLVFGDTSDTAPNLDLTQLILDLALSNNLPTPQFVSSAGGDNATYFGMNSYSRSINQLFDINSTVGISVVTGKAATVDNIKSFNIKFLLNVKNWFIHLNEWKTIGMNEVTQNNLETLLSNLIDLNCSVKHTTLSTENLKVSITLLQ